MRDGFYIGTFQGLYLDNVEVTGKLEIFEMVGNYAYRINDMYIYQHTDFLNPILLDEAPEIQPLKQTRHRLSSGIILGGLETNLMSFEIST